MKTKLHLPSTKHLVHDGRTLKALIIDKVYHKGHGRALLKDFCAEHSGDLLRDLPGPLRSHATHAEAVLGVGVAALGEAAVVEPPDGLVAELSAHRGQDLLELFEPRARFQLLQCRVPSASIFLLRRSPVDLDPILGQLQADNPRPLFEYCAWCQNGVLIRGEDDALEDALCLQAKVELQVLIVHVRGGLKQVGHGWQDVRAGSGVVPIGLRVAITRRLPLPKAAVEARAQAVGLSHPSLHLCHRTANGDDQRRVLQVDLLRKETPDRRRGVNAVLPDDIVQDSVEHARPIKLKHPHDQVRARVRRSEQLDPHLVRSALGSVGCAGASVRVFDDVHAVPHSVNLRLVRFRRICNPRCLVH
mmetsp:Transcript_79792/g.211760  ORF Transcript_79792/g.211760 Transcript_79792/m.211760 type:complete len:360 (+) Transcript_79792:106-1185(+)